MNREGLLVEKKWSKIERVFGCKECVYFLAIIFPWSDCAMVVVIEEGGGTGAIGGRGSLGTHEQGRWRWFLIAMAGKGGWVMITVRVAPLTKCGKEGS